MNQRCARIIGTGTFLPPRIVPNSYFEALVDTSDEWIASRTGIRERRMAEADMFPSTMGAAAARAALSQAGLEPAAIDLVIVATMSGDYPSPSTAALIQHDLGVAVPAFDLQAACSGFVYALATAKAYAESGLAQSILVIATEKMSSLLDYSDRTTCVLFGDGAAAAVVTTQGPGLAIGKPQMSADGGGAELVIIPGGGTRHPTTVDTIHQGLHFFKMQGKELFKQVVRRAAVSSQAVLQEAGILAHEVAWFVPHQANQRLMEAVAKQLNYPSERVYSVVDKYGNTSAAGIAIALHELLAAYPLEDGEHILLNAFGGGLTWGSLLLTQVKN